MDNDSDDDYDSRDPSPQTSDGEGGDRTPISEVDGFEEVVPTNTSSYSVQPSFPNTNNPSSITAGSSTHRPQPNAKEYKTYDIVPLVAAIHGCNIYSLDATRNMRWIFTGGDDGYIRKYDFFASMNGKQLLTQNQKHAQVESVQKAGVFLSYWKNEEPLPSIPVTVPTPAATPGPSPVVVKLENSNGPVNGTTIEEGIVQPEIVPDPPNLDPKLSPVYSLAVQSEALWLLSGLESGGINLFTVRHEEGRCHHVLKEHNGPVSILKITKDETKFISGSWDKQVLYWDLNNVHKSPLMNSLTTKRIWYIQMTFY
ncbi:hypothetical protein G9A89_017540 [Geosiphon pyriformis]|nr:hypothetical protein G9A89_017540 [Geosiphon pyriformis]